jgi:IS1 family transposase
MKGVKTKLLGLPPVNGETSEIIPNDLQSSIQEYKIKEKESFKYNTYTRFGAVLCRGKIHVTYRIERHNEWNML